ncbi:MAG: AraC family transcriptional regulator [Gemmiger sp.]|nr:AraC family transcriptional regulator [Gemmiger sp.]
MEKSYMYTQIRDADVMIKTYHWMEHPAGYEIQRIIPDFDILYTKAGRYQVAINGKGYTSQAGDVLVVPPGSVLTLKACEASRQLYCHFSLTTTERVALGASFGEYRLPEDCAELVHYYSAMVWKSEAAGQPLGASAGLLLKLFLLAMLEAQPENYIRFMGEQVTCLPPEVLTALQYIHEHLAENITAEALARLTGFNAAYFSRYFKKYIGVSPMRYSTRYRLDFARHLVVTTNRGLKEIAALTGFTDQFAFSKRFKEYYGLSPSELRKVQI